MSYADTFAAANDSTFQGRCQVALWSAAGDIVAESPDTADHAARLAWAMRILQDRAAITARQLAIQVLRNATIAANPVGASDGDLQFQVNSILPSLLVIG